MIASSARALRGRPGPGRRRSSASGASPVIWPIPRPARRRTHRARGRRRCRRRCRRRRRSRRPCRPARSRRPRPVAGRPAAGGSRRRGSQRSTTATPTATTTPTRRRPSASPSTNASLAAPISAGAGRAEPLGHAVRAGDRLASAASRAGSGSAAAASPISLAVDRRRATEPSTATPSAPATWRTVLLTAEPTPAFSRGSDDMIDSVAGGMTLAIPTPWTKNSAATTQIGVSAPTNANPRQPIPRSAPGRPRRPPWRRTA